MIALLDAIASFVRLRAVSFTVLDCGGLLVVSVGLDDEAQVIALAAQLNARTTRHTRDELTYMDASVILDDGTRVDITSTPKRAKEAA